MNDKERFDQPERLLTDLIRRIDSQDEFNARQDGFNARQEQRMDNLSDQTGDVIGILKMAAEAQKQSEERQTQMLAQQEGRCTDATQAEILRLMQKWDEQEMRNEAVAERLDNHEPRIQRLEDEGLKQAS